MCKKFSVKAGKHKNTINDSVFTPTIFLSYICVSQYFCLWASRLLCIGIFRIVAKLTEGKLKAKLMRKQNGENSQITRIESYRTWNLNFYRLKIEQDGVALMIQLKEMFSF